MSRRLGAAVVGLSMAIGAVVTPAEAATPPPAVAAPQIGILADALPPGARNILSGIRVLKGIGARNRVYREARHVQRDLRGYYDAQIETATQQLLNREQLGLEPSQVRAYQRAKARLEAERAASLDLTEDEKRAAKYGFESTLKRELTASLIRIPRMRRGLERAKQAIEDVKGAFDKARVAIEGGNPITELVGDLRGKLAKLDRYAELGGLISGDLGRRLRRISETVGGELDKIDGALDEAAGAANTAIAELGAVTSGIDEGLASTRTIRADAAMEQAADALLERVFAPQGDQPETDVLADALARDSLTPLQANVGVALGAIDPADFRRMRDRVRAAMLGRSLERIGDICGRIVGTLRRAQLDAAAAGEPTADTSSPCTLFGDPEGLQAFIDSQQGIDDDDTDTDDDTTTADGGDDGTVSSDIDGGSEAFDGAYVGTVDPAPFLEDGGLTGIVGANNLEVIVDGGVVAAMDGVLAFTGTCEGTDVDVTIQYEFTGASVPIPDDAVDAIEVATTVTALVDVIGRCPVTGDDWEDLGLEIMDELDGATVDGSATFSVAPGASTLVWDFDGFVVSNDLQRMG